MVGRHLGGTSQSSAPAHPLPAAASVVDAAAAAAAPPAVEGVTHSSESAAGAATSLGVLPAVAGGSVLAPGPPPAAGATTSLGVLPAVAGGIVLAPGSPPPAGSLQIWCGEALQNRCEEISLSTSDAFQVLVEITKEEAACRRAKCDNDEAAIHAWVSGAHCSPFA